MLKALELSGFKSFADKCRFEFPAGITVVVGPNGSGKSNIVDAIKWVLGEQSAKSLRGKEMSDVIFKGSGGPNGRRPANSAQATLVLDNSNHQFAFDADEIHISRRVYRSGETEYLINGEASRLKDIRNLIRGTGVGTDAYSLIEQGKVERMLSTSPKERRAIFEEAAGISRFKAKKVEAERRLTRVEGNLIRLADIVEEVGSRYRSIKAQASRAARYRDYTTRLQQLRTFVGLKDWREFSTRLTELESSREAHTGQSTELRTAIESLNKQVAEAESKVDAIALAVAAGQEKSAEVREQIAGHESTLKINQSRLADIDARAADYGNSLTESKQHAEELAQEITDAEKQLDAAELAFRESADQLVTLEQQQTEIDQTISSLQAGSESNRSRYQFLIAAVTEIGRLVSAADSQRATGQQEQQRLTASVNQLTGELTEAREAYHAHQQSQEKLKTDAEATDTALAEARKSFQQYRGELAGRESRLGELTNRHAGLTQRASVIEELEQSLTGINAGARELLQRAKSDQSGYLGEIIGIVADAVTVNVQHAGIVDVALGDVAQHIIVDGQQLINELAAERLKLSGRVGVIQFDEPPTMGADPAADLDGQPGVIGRVDRLVQVEPSWVDFVRQLLGGTWVVKTLDDALRLHEQSTRPVRLVTLDGEIVEPDSTVIAGPRSANTGLVSRRSELRALTREVQNLDEEIKTCSTQVDELKELTATAETEVQRLIGENSGLVSRLDQETTLATTVRSRIEKLQQDLDASTTQQQSAVSLLANVESKLTTDRQTLLAQETEIAELNQLISSGEQQSSELSQRQSAVQQKFTSAKVAAARNEQQLENLQSRLAGLRQQHEQRTQGIAATEQKMAADRELVESTNKSITEATESLERLRAEKDQIADKVEQDSRSRMESDKLRQELAVSLTEQRDAFRELENRLNQAGLEVGRLTMQRDQLAARMQEDYDIDLASTDETPTDEEMEQREEVDAEITELRSKIGQIGSVNLEALTELEELETRYNHLDGQYQDLVQAKETLEKIIVRINADSRKLFVETLEAIRSNFQKLFRQTFGGGHADIILEEGVDPLEAGVEIIATPPGKPEFNNSLLSGGEKALTAVSLLMAIFQFRPSPFCVLDEVDAPFDEANIGRFIDVLKSFLGWTKFVIVTHSKKTMTAATTLYGITMQESGISKRVSVKFEDVSEDGHISDAAIRRNDPDAA